MTGKRSIDRFPNGTAKSEEFPSFLQWVRLILLWSVGMLVLGFIVYPLILRLASWFLLTHADPGLNDLLARRFGRWRRASDPRLLGFLLCYNACLILTYPVFTMLWRFETWVNAFRHPPNAKIEKKKRIE
ncbi:hypothetical protein CA13_49110 [Planctomycetes bacterium CA13]|uniref:Uncharacterized protein n=1 Tax=Novipirellula herctigrandis TaxID=2527986 RepID=A0A5C5Z8N1_9BACT|nr:hypothetical protein CA13_49110 [Planctomycetes bacterium CA13]